jgi:predicted ArsR family transcriptional regulator
MTPLPRSFAELAEDLARRAPAARRHLLLLGHEGLYPLERWRLLRSFEAGRRMERFI